LLLALEGYIECLRLQSTHKDVRLIFRLCSLWFSNAHSKAVSMLLQPKLQRIATRKFLPLVYQIISRLSTPPPNDTRATRFQSLLASIVVRLGKEYPHHSLCQLFALSATDTQAKSSAATRTSWLSSAYVNLVD